MTTKTRNNNIRKSLKNGKSLTTLAAKYELSVTRVWQIANNVRAA